MTRDPFMNQGNDFERFLEKLNVEEKDTLVLEEKVDFMSRIAVDNLYEKAAGSVVSEKGPSLLALTAHRDPRCSDLALEFMSNDNLDLKSFGIKAAIILKDVCLIEKLEELLLDNSASIRIKAVSALVHLHCSGLSQKLAVVLNDPVWFVREKLAVLLVETGYAPDLLAKLQMDPNPNVRRASLFSRAVGL